MTTNKLHYALELWGFKVVMETPSAVRFRCYAETDGQFAALAYATKGTSLTVSLETAVVPIAAGKEKVQYLLTGAEDIDAVQSFAQRLTDAYEDYGVKGSLIADPHCITDAFWSPSGEELHITFADGFDLLLKEEDFINIVRDHSSFTVGSLDLNELRTHQGDILLETTSGHYEVTLSGSDLRRKAEQRPEPELGSVWRHYKSAVDYTVIATDVLIEAHGKQKTVLYSDGHLKWCRPLADFMEYVNTEDGRRPRFVKVCSGS